MARGTDDVRGTENVEGKGAPWRGLMESARRRAGAALVDNMFLGLSRVGQWHPGARPERHRVEVVRDIPYRLLDRGLLDRGLLDRAQGHPPTRIELEHRLDVYRPAFGEGPWPVVLYVHGGGFRILSKDTHWVMALAYARRGYCVFNISYRLAPRHRFPAALQDVCTAWRWILEHAPRYGGDLDRVVVAGESAGANLALSLVLATTMKRPEPWATEVFELGRVPDACVPACGIFQVSDTLRFARRHRPVSAFVLDRFTEVTDAYLGEAGLAAASDHALADPLLLLEDEPVLARPLPPVFLPVGTRDPLEDDTRRLHRALGALRAPCEVCYYDGERHAFHALVWRPNARRCWRDTYAFLDRALERPPSSA